MRLFVALIAAFGAALLSPSAFARTGADWSASVTRLADGDIAIGDPDAPATLTEYLSYTCPHCAEFVVESQSVLMDAMVKSGAMRVEIRNAVRDPLDLAAAMLTRCAAPERVLAFHKRIFADQAALESAARTVPGMYSRLAIATADDVAAVAKGSGLIGIAMDAGMSDSRITACLADTDALENIRATASRYWKTIGGTPAFAIDDSLTGVHDWAELRPLLRAAARQ